MNLLASGHRVVSPFIVLDIAGVKLGAFSREQKKTMNEQVDSTIYPNFVRSATVAKNANGMVNQYVINLEYQVTQYDDPNFIEKLFSKISEGRRIKVSYGDMMNPVYSFREEECLVSSVQRQITPQTNKITYIINAVSAVALKVGGTYTFPARTDKPSNIIKEILYNTKYGMLDVLTGLVDKDKVEAKGYLAANDLRVAIPPKENITVIEYIKFLVSCMKDSDGLINEGVWMLSFEGDELNEMGGGYVKLVKSTERSLDEFTVDINYPSVTEVYDFRLTENNMYSLIYNYNEKLGQPQYTRELNSKGEIVMAFRSPLAIDPKLLVTTPEGSVWWTEMTRYPIKGVLTVKGLIRPVILTSAININYYFFGQKYNASGRYRIISQTDRISDVGYFTDLGVMRV